MSKHDSLLKQIQVFEKIAIYGSRKDFLTALAQEVEPNYSPMPENVSRPGDENLPAIPFESLPVYKEPAIPLESIPIDKAPVPASKPVNAALLQAQKDLNTLNIGGTKGPLNPDGIRGTETQYALNQYRSKNRLRMPSPDMSDELLYVMIHRDATGQNPAPDLYKLHNVVEKGPKPHRASRIELLRKISQNLSNGAVAFPDESVSGAIGAVVGTSNNLARMLESNNQTNSYELNMAKKISTLLDNAKVPSYVNNKSELDSKADSIKSLLGNAMDIGMRVAVQPNSQIKEIGNQLENEAKKANTLIDNFYRRNGIYPVDIESTLSPHTPAVSSAPVTKTQISIADAAKNLSKVLENRVDRLSTGSQRLNQLKIIENEVKALQRYFRSLQKSNDSRGYLARMAIVSALQKVYSILEYGDLDIVQSLNAGAGIPETPDSKI